MSAAFVFEAPPTGAENEALWGEWSEDVGWGREGDIRVCIEGASDFTGICREGEVDVG
jgi:hypothetical protein